ncbi:MAG: response regulator [Calditrichaeota bacterium]|nr:MAG: response regulator [Calditrichota bacterium]
MAVPLFERKFMTARILIFEDNESLRNSITFVLKKFNYEVESFSNPREVDLKLIKSLNKTDLDR